MEEKLLETLFALLAIPAPSGEEAEVASYCAKRLNDLGCNVRIDKKGNVIGFLPGQGEPLLLTAHMDRVPPNKSIIPIRNGDMLTSDGTSTLGADDAAGIAIILEAVHMVVEKKSSHVPLVIVFTVGEEIGLQGARAVDISEFHVKHGIGYDNAFAAGTLVEKGATYEGFDVEIMGKPTHPAKDLSQAVNTFTIVREIDWMIGEQDKGQTRINVGIVTAGTARNVVPGTAHVTGELRSFLSDVDVTKRLSQLRQNILAVCKKYGASYTFETHRHSTWYVIDRSEMLVQKYTGIRKEKNESMVFSSTFIGSDANVFRAEKGMKVFTLSTGVIDEHTVKESVRVSDLVMVAEDLVDLLRVIS